MRNKQVFWITLGIAMLFVIIMGIADYLENANVVTTPEKPVGLVNPVNAGSAFYRPPEQVPSAILDYGGALGGCCILEPDRFACITRNGSLILFSRQKTLAKIDLGVGQLEFLDAAPATKRLIVTGKHEVLLLDTETGAVLARAQDRDKQISNACFVYSGKAVLVVRADGMVAKYDAGLQSRKELLDLAKVPGLSPPFEDVVSNGSNLLTMRSSKSHVVLRYGDSGVHVDHFVPYQDDSWYISHAAPSPDGARLLVVRPNQLQELDAKTGHLVKQFPIDGLRNGLVRYSPDGKYFCCGSWFGAAAVYRAVDGARILELPNERGCRDAAFSLDSKKLLMTTCYDTDDNGLEAQCRLFEIP